MLNINQVSLSSNSDYISRMFPVTHLEYEELDRKLGKLCYKAAWVLKSKNFANNFIDDTEDIVQQLRMAMVKAGSYTKRQVYIEACLDVLRAYVKDPFIRKVITSLRRLWKKRTRHGANRQKFGILQEVLLERLIKKHVPKEMRPNRHAPLVVDASFMTYCKQIVWNSEKSMGKKITKEKEIRQGLVSLSEYDYLGSIN